LPFIFSHQTPIFERISTVFRKVLKGALRSCAGWKEDVFLLYFLLKMDILFQHGLHLRFFIRDIRTMLRM
jgi:hypothetical protein